jgi:hypothetical protein
VVERDVAGDAQDPGRERDLACLVLDEDGHQLREDLLRDVLRLVVVAHDAADVAVDVVRVADVEEAQGLAVPRLRPGDGGGDDPLGDPGVVERGAGDEAPVRAGAVELVGPGSQSVDHGGVDLPCSFA